MVQQTGNAARRKPQTTVQRSIQHVPGNIIQRGWWGQRWQAIRRKLTWANIKNALGKAFGGPIYQLIIYLKYRNSQDADEKALAEQQFSIAHFKRYWAMLKSGEKSAGAYGGVPILNRLPAILKIIELFIGEVGDAASTFAIWFGLLGLIPFCQALLPLSGTFAGVSFFANLARLGITSVLDAWSNFLALYRYRRIEEAANKQTGALPQTGEVQRMIRSYLAGLGEYQSNRGAYMTRIVSTGASALTGSLGGLAVGKSAGDAFASKFDPTQAFGGAVKDIGNTTTNLHTAVDTYRTDQGWTGGWGERTGYGLGQNTDFGHAKDAVRDVSPFLSETSKETSKGAFGEHREAGGGNTRVNPGIMPNIREAESYPNPGNVQGQMGALGPGAFTNLKQIPKAPLTTVSGKIRGMLNPFTAIYQVIAGAIAIVRGVITAVGAILKAIKAVLGFIASPVESAKKIRYWFKKPHQGDPGNRTGAGRWWAKKKQSTARWWNRNMSEDRTGEGDYQYIQPKLQPGVQRSPILQLEREDEEEQEQMQEQESDSTQPTSGEMPEEQQDPTQDVKGQTREVLESMSKENKAQSISDKLQAIEQVMSGTLEDIKEAADETAKVEQGG